MTAGLLETPVTQSPDAKEDECVAIKPREVLTAETASNAVLHGLNHDNVAKSQTERPASSERHHIQKVTQVTFAEPQEVILDDRFLVVPDASDMPPGITENNKFALLDPEKELHQAFHNLENQNSTNPNEGSGKELALVPMEDRTTCLSDGSGTKETSKGQLSP